MMHQRISRKIIIYIFTFFTLVTVTNSKLPNNFYVIKELDISGLNSSEREKIYNDIKIFKNSNIFLFDKKDISKKIYSNKIVEEFKISKIYPSTLNIEIKKAEFLAITKNNNNDYLVGSNGKLIEIENNYQNLPFIFGDIDIDNFLNFKKIVDNSNLDFNEIQDLYYFKSNRWDIKTKDGLTIKMPYDLTVKKLNLIFVIIQKENFKDIEIIDLRQDNMMVING